MFILAPWIRSKYCCKFPAPSTHLHHSISQTFTHLATQPHYIYTYSHDDNIFLKLICDQSFPAVIRDFRHQKDDELCISGGFCPRIAIEMIENAIN